MWTDATDHTVQECGDITCYMLVEGCYGLLGLQNDDCSLCCTAVAGTQSHIKGQTPPATMEATVKPAICLADIETLGMAVIG